MANTDNSELPSATPGSLHSVVGRTLQIETVTTAAGKMDVIRDIETVRRVIAAAEHLAARLRLWRTDNDGEMICEGDADALKEWDAISPNKN